LSILALISFAIVMSSLSALAQELVPLFPAEGESIRFSQLVEEGFQWAAPDGAVAFKIRMSGPDPVLSNIHLPTTASPLKLESVLESYFKPSTNYHWLVEITDGAGAGTVSTTISFAITDQTDLIPTPTPIGGPSTDPTPVPAVGLPRNLSFSPNDMPGFFADNFYILWDPPTAPSGVAFLYDILIQHEYATYQDEKRGLEVTSFSYKTATLEGIYYVYLRARVEGVGTSEIVTGQFQVKNQATLPTPTPVPQSPDISANQVADVLDVAMFAKSYKRRDGQVGFNPRADLFTDGIVDAKDLILFFSLYRKRESGVDAPQWLSVEIPVLGADYQPTGDEPIVVKLPPNEVHFGYASNSHALAELYRSIITFSEMSGVSQYYVTVRSELDSNYLLSFYTEKTSLFNDTENNQYVIIRLVPGDTLVFHVQAVGENLELRESSEALRLIIPSQ